MPTPIVEGLAVVFGELADSNFSGIGISCGSGLCNVCLAVLSVPVISFSVPKAGDFIDSQAAAGDRRTGHAHARPEGTTSASTALTATACRTRSRSTTRK